MAKGRRNEGQRGARSGVLGLKESEMRVSWKGRARNLRKVVGKAQK